MSLFSFLSPSSSTKNLTTSSAESNSAGSAITDSPFTQSFDIGALDLGTGSTFTFQPTDFGAINLALEGIGFANQSIVDESQLNREFASQGATFIVNKAFEAGAGAVNLIVNEFDKNRHFLGQAFDAGADLLQSGVKQIGRFFDDVSKREAEGNLITLDLIGDQFKSTLNGITGFVDKVLLDNASTTASLLTGFSEQATKSIDVLGEATRSDSANALNQVTKFAFGSIVAIGAIGGAVLFFGGRK